MTITLATELPDEQHHLGWNDGNITIEECIVDIGKRLHVNDQVWVKGTKSKLDYVRNFLLREAAPSHIDLREITNAPPYEQLNTCPWIACPTHEGMCARQNTHELIRYVELLLKQDFSYYGHHFSSLQNAGEDTQSRYKLNAFF